jgi:hypothetical protein
MKIKAEVIAVESNGEKIKVRVQGIASSDPAWLSMSAHSFELYANQKNQRSYWIGRKVEIEIKPT